MVEELKTPEAKFAPHPQISGKNGGESLNLHQFARDGVVLLGHVRDAHDGQLIIAPDLKQTLAKVDQFETDALAEVSLSSRIRQESFEILISPSKLSRHGRATYLDSAGEIGAYSCDRIAGFSP